MAPSNEAGTPKKAASKKKTKLKAKKSTAMKNSSSVATVSTVRKKKKSKNEEPPKGLKLLKRNCVHMKRVSNRNNLRQKRTVQFNRKGIPYGKVAQEMQSYLGVIARKRIPIVRTNWRTASLKNPGGVTAEEKDKLWERVQVAFVIGNECKKMVLKSASAKWREFKSQLTSWYIIPYLNEPEKMKYPPQDYKFISQDHSTQFVADRTDPSFLTLRKIQQAKRQLNKYPHRLSRKGYAGLEEELLRSENLTDDEELERFFMWIEARKGKNGTFKDDETKKKAEEILQLKEKVDCGEESLSGSVDILEKALGTKEHGGRVRGVGGYVTPTTYFHHPRRKRANIQETIKMNVDAYIAQIKDKIIAEAKKQAVEEFKAQLKEKKQQPGSGGEGQVQSCPGLLEKHISPVSGEGSCSQNTCFPVNQDLEVGAEHAVVGEMDVGAEHAVVGEKDVRVEHEVVEMEQEKEVTGKLNVEVLKEMDAEAGKWESEGQKKRKLSEEAIRSCIEAMDHKEVAKKKIPKRKGGEAKSRQKTKVVVEEVAVDTLPVTPLRRSPRKITKNVATVEVPVLLAVGSVENIVGTGTVLQGDPNQLIHGVPLGEGNVRVSVSVPKQENAKVPFPVGDDIVTVRQACGSWVAWPEELIIYTPLSPSEKPPKKRKSDDEDFVDAEDFVDDEDFAVSYKVFDSKLLRDVAAGLPNSLSMLCMWGEEGFKNDKVIELNIEAEVFGEIRKTCIFGDDVLRMASMKEVIGNCIVIYQRYLYDVLKKYQMLDMFAFVDPVMVGGDKACGPTKNKVEYLTGRLKTSQPGQLFMVAYNADYHWVLTIIDPQNEKVYFLDPIKRWLPLGSSEWKTVVNSAVGKYNEYIGRTSLKAVEWKPLTGIPHQPNAVECGYYVMRYMRDIVEDKDQSNFMTKWSRRDSGLEYTQDEIDVVRNEWAKFIVSTYM